MPYVFLTYVLYSKLYIILEYKNFMKLNKFKIFESTYKDLLNKYLSKSKNKIKQIYIQILLLFIINII